MFNSKNIERCLNRRRHSLYIDLPNCNLFQPNSNLKQFCYYSQFLQFNSCKSVLVVDGACNLDVPHQSISETRVLSLFQLFPFQSNMLYLRFSLLQLNRSRLLSVLIFLVFIFTCVGYNGTDFWIFGSKKETN